MESYPPKAHFRKTIFWPLGDAAPLKFLDALENDQILLAHPTGDGDPFFTIFSCPPIGLRAPGGLTLSFASNF